MNEQPSSPDGAPSTAAQPAVHDAADPGHEIIDASARLSATSDIQAATLSQTNLSLQEQVHLLRDLARAQASDIFRLQKLLAGVTRRGNNLRFTGMNLQVVNGTNATHGTPNAVGNVIIGYNAPRDDTTAADRAGSHSLVIGDQHHWTSYGHLIAGARNTASGPSASVSGGYRNTASRPQTSVTGGTYNRAEATSASVSGGVGNIADGPGASVSGGHDNKATGLHASVSGGDNNIASGGHTWASGGKNNKAQGAGSSIVGGNGVTTWGPNDCHSC